MRSLAELLDHIDDAPCEPVERTPLAWSDVHLVERGGACAWDVPRCEACAGVEAVDGVRCPCAGLARRAHRLTLAGIPWPYRGAVLDDGSRAAQWVEAWRDGSPGLRILGPPGVGKTWRAVAMVRALCDRRVSARYVLWSAWVRAMRAAMGRDADHEALRARVLRPAVVVLDDLGRERVTDYTADLLDDVLGGRLDATMTVIVASNAGDAELEGYLGPRLWSRLRGATQAAVMQGTDRRAPRGAGGV